MTDPHSYEHLSVLPAAVEAAQRVASEYVATALATADRAGYERGLREGRAGGAAPEGLLALLKRAEAALIEIEGSGTSLDSHCDELTVVAKRRGRRQDVAVVPDEGDAFGDVAKFLSDYGGKSLVDPDEIEVDADEVRNCGTVLAGECSTLREILDEARALLAPETDAPETDEDEGTGDPTECQ
jgi:hypothetical protein